MGSDMGSRLVDGVASPRPVRFLPHGLPLGGRALAEGTKGPRLASHPELREVSSSGWKRPPARSTYCRGEGLGERPPLTLRGDDGEVWGAVRIVESEGEEARLGRLSEWE